MVSIDINEVGSYRNLEILKRIFREKKWTSVEVSMNYSPNIGLPSQEDPENWPFVARVMEDGETYIVRIYSLTVGYGGSGPHDFANILDFFEIKYDEEDIFTKRKMNQFGFINLKYFEYFKR